MPIKKVKTQAQLRLELSVVNGIVHSVGEEAPVQLHYENPHGRLFLGDSVAWMNGLAQDTADLIFADPPYNLGKADWDVFASLDEYVDWSRNWVIAAERILKPHGTLYICGFSEILAHVYAAISRMFPASRWIVWHYKNKANLGSGWGRSHESILLLRKSKKEFTFNIDDVRVPYGAHTLKYPVHPQAETSQYGKNGNSKEREHWTPNPRGAKPKDVFDIPTTCNGMGEKTPHPTQKPEELLRKLVIASSNPGDVVLDPFSGSGTTAVVAQQLGRRWLACDCCGTYNEWAIHRLEQVAQKSVEEWIRFDMETALRREKIR